MVCWKRNVLLAEPPPFMTNMKWNSSPEVAYMSNCAGRLEPVFFSVNMSVGTTWE